MKSLFLLILFLHGALHFLGFYKAFAKVTVVQLSGYIPKPIGFLWLLCGILFLFVLILVWLDEEWWPFFAIAAVILSQTLIVNYWQEAKFGTILNVVILLVSIPALASFNFDKTIKKEVKEPGVALSAGPLGNLTIEENNCLNLHPFQQHLI